MNLKNRFIMPTVILIILGMSISNAIYYFKSREALLNALSDQLMGQAETISRLMDDAIENIRLNFVYWSGDAILTTVVQEYIGEMVRESSRNLLIKIRSDYGYYETLMAVDSRGMIISGTDERDIGTDIRDRKFFKEAIKGRFYISDVYVSEISHQPVFVVSGPLFMEGEIVGALCGVVAMSYFNDNYIKPVKIGEKGYAFVFKKDGLMIAHPMSAAILTFNIYNDLPRKIRVKEQTGLVHYTFQGMKKMAAIQTSKKMSWMVGVSAEKNEFLKPVTHLTYLNIGVLCLVSISIISGVCWLVQTVTKQLEEIFDLRIAKQGAEAASRSKSEFLANMSHEIRTPMNAVLGFTDLLESEINDPKQKKYLEAISISGKNLLRLINDILDLSKIEAGKLDLAPEAMDPFALFNEIKKIFELETAGKRLEFEVDVSPDIPRGLILDEVRLRQILVNLVGNAVKFTEKGRIAIGVQKTGIPQDAYHINLKITVSDTGVGIPADSLEKIFEAFSQLSGQDAKSYAGTGLGLTITRNLVEMMGGRISVQSKVHQGSTFEILLPCVAVASSLDKPLAREFLDTENLRFHEAAVLVVDDNELNRQLVGEILRSSGLKAFEAEDGEKGVAAALRHQPDVILMDIRMPVMDGYEALNRLRNSSQTRHIPVIALTASAMKEEKRKILKSQFDGYVVKPVEKQLLFRALARFLPYSILSDTETAGDRPPVFHKPIPPGVLKNIPGVIENLEAFMAEWAAVRQKQYIPDIQHFGEEIKKLGDQHEIKEVSEYGDHLLFHISSYDIEKIFTALEMYPNLIETLKEINQGEHLS